MALFCCTLFLFILFAFPFPHPHTFAAFTFTHLVLLWFVVLALLRCCILLHCTRVHIPHLVCGGRVPRARVLWRGVYAFVRRYAVAARCALPHTLPFYVAVPLLYWDGLGSFVTFTPTALHYHTNRCGSISVLPDLCCSSPHYIPRFTCVFLPCTCISAFHASSFYLGYTLPFTCLPFSTHGLAFMLTFAVYQRAPRLAAWRHERDCRVGFWQQIQLYCGSPHACHLAHFAWEVDGRRAVATLTTPSPPP